MKFLYSSLFILSSSLSFAQTWEPVGGGVQWADSTSDYLPVYALQSYMNKLYVGGSFKAVGKIKANNIASWDGKKWDTLQGGTNGSVRALGEYKKFLFVGGVFTSAGGKRANNIAYWIDTTRTIPRWYYIMGRGIEKIQWTDTYSKTTVAEDVVNSIAEYNGNLYVGGYFDEVGLLTVGKIVKWNDKDSWSPVGKSMKSMDGTPLAPGFLTSEIFAMTKYKGKLFVGGYIDGYKDEKIKCLAVWNDTAFYGASKTIPVDGPRNIFCMAVYDSCLYVGGTFNTNQKFMPAKDKPYNGLAKWDGKMWTVIEGIQGFGNIYSMAVLNDKLYIGGRFDSVGNKSANNIAVWDGKTLEPVGAGFLNKGKLKGLVNALCVYKDELYAGGYFTSSGGVTLNHIAKLNLKGTKPPSTKRKK